MSVNNYDSRRPIYIPDGIWLSQDEYNVKCTNNPLYDFCSFLSLEEGEHKGKICAVIATKICRLEHATPNRFRCESCPLAIQDLQNIALIAEEAMVLTPSSDSKLARVAKHAIFNHNNKKTFSFLF